MAYLSARQLAGLLSISVRSVWRLAAAGKLPEPVRLGRRIARWREADVEAAVARLGGKRADAKGGAADEQDA